MQGAPLPDRPSPRRRWPAALLLALLFVLVAIHGGRGASGDFLVFHTAGERFLAGAPLYPFPDLEVEARYGLVGDFSTFKYAPAFALLMAPLSLLSPVTAQILWNELNLVLLLLCLRWLRDLCPGPDGQPAGWWQASAGVLITLAPVQLNFVYAQSNLLTLAGLVLGAWLVLRGRAAAGGTWMGLTAALKISPLLIAGYPLVKRRWSWLAGIALGLLLCIGVPWLLHGPSLGSKQLASWYRMVRTDPVFHTLHPRNQSLWALLAATFSPEYGPAHFAFPDGRHLDGVRNFAPLPSYALAQAVTAALAAGLYLATLAWLSRTGAPRSRRLAGELSLLVTTFLLCSPYTLRHHLVWLLLPSAWLVSEWRRAAAPADRRLLLAAIAWQALFFSLSDVARASSSLYQFLLAWQVHAWGLLGAYAFQLAALRRLR